MGLIASIVGIGASYLLLHSAFRAIVRLMVYAGAFVILFIFVVMLLGPAATSPSDAGSAVPRYLGAGVFLACFAGAGALIMSVAAERTAAAPLPAPDGGFGTIEALGHELFTSKVVPFELTGALLLVAVVGALAVGRGKQADPTLASGASPDGSSLAAARDEQEPAS